MLLCCITFCRRRDEGFNTLKARHLTPGRLSARSQAPPPPHAHFRRQNCCLRAAAALMTALPPLSGPAAPCRLTSQGCCCAAGPLSLPAWHSQHQLYIAPNHPSMSPTIHWGAYVHNLLGASNETQWEVQWRLQLRISRRSCPGKAMVCSGARHGVHTAVRVEEPGGLQAAHARL